MEFIHTDDFILDVGDLSEKRAAAFCEFPPDKKNPPSEAGERFNDLMSTSRQTSAAAELAHVHAAISVATPSGICAKSCG
jgi:hypothetical protein